MMAEPVRIKRLWTYKVELIKPHVVIVIVIDIDIVTGIRIYFTVFM